MSLLTYFVPYTYRITTFYIWPHSNVLIHICKCKIVILLKGVGMVAPKIGETSAARQGMNTCPEPLLEGYGLTHAIIVACMLYHPLS